MIKIESANWEKDYLLSKIKILSRFMEIGAAYKHHCSPKTLLSSRQARNVAFCDLSKE